MPSLSNIVLPDLFLGDRKLSQASVRSGRCMFATQLVQLHEIVFIDIRNII